jgi:hypothetical protein
MKLRFFVEIGELFNFVPSVGAVAYVNEPSDHELVTNRHQMCPVL